MGITKRKIKMRLALIVELSELLGSVKGCHFVIDDKETLEGYLNRIGTKLEGIVDKLEKDLMSNCDSL